jgi:hypothetical protein
MSLAATVRRSAARAVLLLTLPAALSAQVWLNTDPNTKVNKSTFRALEEWPSPNEARTASGAPGTRYWQQRVDYVIKATLDTASHSITATQRVTYHNNSPDKLGYVWFQLDQNIDKPDSRAFKSKAAIPEGMKSLSPDAKGFLFPEIADGGYTISRVALVDATGKSTPARHVINGTVMRVDLAAPIGTGQSARIDIDFKFVVGEQSLNGRGGREEMKDGWIYEVAQWFPRASVYDDISGWQTDQFLGQGEFYLNFGNYDVSLTVPRNHIVQATGVLQNSAAVLTATQRARLVQAMASDKPVFIVGKDDVGAPGARPAGSGPLTWRFVAENVRDFAWGSSKAFVWDAQGYRYRPGGKVIELHSLYPKEAMPLWSDVSTKAVRQTMITYGRMAFEYPYPKAVNINGPVYGMEYPMVAFCGGRPAADGTYDKRREYALAAVTIHEVGHNWFPMIVASDERKWTWMDEGINSFLEYYGSKDYDPAWPANQLRGPAPNIAGYMRQPNQMPLMTESDYILGQTFGNNGYSKPATGLVMLRENIIGAEAFDRAFREYSNRWAFKHPQPFDFFRSMDDGAGELLNWFWRGWFYTTYANDQAITSVTSQPAKELWGDESKGTTYTRVTVEQQGGLVMPIQLEVQYEDGTREKVAIPVEAWRTDEKKFTYGFFSKRAVTNVIVDPDNVFADVKRDNNTWKKPDAKPIG